MCQYACMYNIIICTFVESSWNECNPVAWQPKKWQVQVGSTLYELPLLFTVTDMQTGEEEEEGDMHGMSTHVIALHIYTCGCTSQRYPLQDEPPPRPRVDVEEAMQRMLVWGGAR